MGKEASSPLLNVAFIHQNVRILTTMAEDTDMGEISTSTSGAVQKTNKEMINMGYQAPMRPKSIGMKRPSIRKPKMRAFSRGK